MEKSDEFINPFETGKFNNPAVSLEESRKRCSDKRKRKRETSYTPILGCGDWYGP